MKAFTWLVALTPFAADAASWIFSDPVEISDPALAPHYQHLDGSGRQHLAVSGDQLALVWEDDRDGVPRVYAAVKPLDADRFPHQFPLGGGEESYEPSVVSVEAGRWLAAWEQDGRIVATLFDSGGPGETVQLSGDAGRQVTLASAGNGMATAVWGLRQGRKQVLVAGDLTIGESSLVPGEPVPVSTPGSSDYQGYPAAVLSGDGSLFVAWEDRRAGHTRIFGSRRRAGGSFETERQLNEHRAPEISESWLANKGTGAMRVSLAATRAGELASTWLDKRSPGSGYAVWGAMSLDHGVTFGPNFLVQDSLGDAVAQWHASVRHGPAGMVAVWDDARENWSDESETGDVIISWQSAEGWSEDLLVPGASGPGYQGSPVMAMDARAQLHLVWIEKDAPNAPSRLRYLRGVAPE